MHCFWAVVPPMEGGSCYCLQRRHRTLRGDEKKKKKKVILLSFLGDKKRNKIWDATMLLDFRNCLCCCCPPLQVLCLNLKWGAHEDSSSLKALKPDVILGADIIYDVSVIPQLLALLTLLLKKEDAPPHHICQNTTKGPEGTHPLG